MIEKSVNKHTAHCLSAPLVHDIITHIYSYLAMYLIHTVMPYFTCIFGIDDSDESIVDTTPDLRSTLSEMRALYRPKLLYYEHFTNASKAIDRHLELKHTTEDARQELVRNYNPHGEDLALLL